MYGDYRREIAADMIYGFQTGDPNYWRECRSSESSFKAPDPNTGAMHKTGRPECIICMDKLRESDLVSPLPCHVNHLFHTACIRPWLLKNRNCPLCKREVDPRDLSNVTGSFMLNQTLSATNPNNSSSMMSLSIARHYSSTLSR